MTTPLHAAEYLLWLGRGDQDGITPLKLQKLLYYGQSAHMAFNGGEPLFEEDMEAWPHGPVTPSIYRKYKNHGRRIIRHSASPQLMELSESERHSLEMAFKYFGQYSAARLREMTHAEKPWILAGDGGTLSKREMERYFLNNWADILDPPSGEWTENRRADRSGSLAILHRTFG